MRLFVTLVERPRALPVLVAVVVVFPLVVAFSKFWTRAHLFNCCTNVVRSRFYFCLSDDYTRKGNFWTSSLVMWYTALQDHVSDFVCFFFFFFFCNFVSLCCLNCDTYLLCLSAKCPCSIVSDIFSAEYFSNNIVNLFRRTQKYVRSRWKSLALWQQTKWTPTEVTLIRNRNTRELSNTTNTTTPSSWCKLRVQAREWVRGARQHLFVSGNTKNTKKKKQKNALKMNGTWI